MASKLYYGNGNCSIDGYVRTVDIRFRGAIEITDKTSDDFVISYHNNRLIVFPIRGKETLDDLFDYVGEFKITSVLAVNELAEIEPCTYHRVMDYTELLNSNSEDLTVNTENLKSTHISGKKVSKTILYQPIIPNLNTNDWNMVLYLKDGTEYSGYFHIHLSNSSSMTGAEHDKDSQDLYYKKINNDELFPTKNESHIPPAIKDDDKKKMILKKKMQDAFKGRLPRSRRSNRERRKY